MDPTQAFVIPVVVSSAAGFVASLFGSWLGYERNKELINWRLAKAEEADKKLEEVGNLKMELALVRQSVSGIEPMKTELTMLRQRIAENEEFRKTLHEVVVGHQEQGKKLDKVYRELTKFDD